MDGLSFPEFIPMDESSVGNSRLHNGTGSLSSLIAWRVPQDHKIDRL